MHALSISGNPDKRNGHCRVSINLHLAVIASSRVESSRSSCQLISAFNCACSEVKCQLAAGARYDRQFASVKIVNTATLQQIAWPGSLCTYLPWPLARAQTGHDSIYHCHLSGGQSRTGRALSVFARLKFALCADFR